MNEARGGAGDGLVVELCGLPGAGKSTLCAALTERLQRTGMSTSVCTEPVGPGVPRLRRLQRKLTLTAGGVRAGPVASVRVARAILASQPTWRDGIHRCVAWFVAQRLAARPSAGVVHLLDEGPIQSLWSVALSGDEERVHRVLKQDWCRWVVPDLLVVVDVPPTRANQRLRARTSAHSRISRLDDDRVRMHALLKGSVALERLLAWVEHLGERPRVLRVECEAVAPGSVEVVVGAVAYLMSHPSARASPAGRTA